jgi:hypothetical protein
MTKYTIGLRVFNEQGKEVGLFLYYGPGEWWPSDSSPEPKWMSTFELQDRLQHIGYANWPEDQKRCKRLVIIPQRKIDVMIGRKFLLKE